MNFFICPGAQKAGTTLLYELLCQHPEIHMSSKKETKYFLKTPNEISKDEYIRLFYPTDINRQPKPKIFGEIDPEYLYYKDVPEKIADTLGKEIKLIFLLRHPVDRAYSHYWMSYQRGFELLDFKAALEHEPERLKAQDKMALWHQSYADRGFYTKQIENYLHYFDKDNMKFILFDEFMDDKSGILKEVLNFLDVDNKVSPIDSEFKSNEGVMPKSETLRKLHGQPSRLKSVLKVMLPSRKLRWWLYPIVEKLNKSKKKYPKLSDQHRRELLQKYFPNEIRDLEKLTGLEIRKYWNK